MLLGASRRESVVSPPFNLSPRPPRATAAGRVVFFPSPFSPSRLTLIALAAVDHVAVGSVCGEKPAVHDYVLRAVVWTLQSLQAGKLSREGHSSDI